MKKAFLVLCSLMTTIILIFTYCSALAEDYDSLKPSELSSLGVTSSEWYDYYTNLASSIEAWSSILITSQDKSTNDDYTIHYYKIVPGLQIILYCDKSTDVVMKAFVNLNWKGLSNSEMSKASELMDMAYLFMAVSTDYPQADAGVIPSNLDDVDPSSLKLGYYRQSIKDGYVYYGSFPREYELEKGFFKETTAETKNETENSSSGTNSEILFRGLPWGTNLPEAKEKLGWDIWGLTGEYMKTYSIDDIVLGDYEGIRFEYSDINIIGNVSTKDISVAGYTTSDVELYFAYVPKDGIVTHEEADSALYGARYEFEPKNREAMVKDLKEKLTSQYGTPTKTSKRSDFMGNKYNYVFWLGANDTEVVLCDMEATKDSTLYKDEVKICYIWLKGDEMLQAASDAEKQADENAESNNYGNSNTDGL